MKKITYLLLFVILALGFNSCKDKPEYTKNLNYVSFEAQSFAFGVDLEGTNVRNIKVYTTQITSSVRTFNINVLTANSSADPTSYTVPATVTIPANSNVGEFAVSISDINIDPDNGETLVLGIEATDDLITGSNITLNIVQVCPFNEVALSILFDSWPEETYWALLDSDDNVIYSTSEGDYAATSNRKALFTKTFCLENGTYTFIIYDAYGDGTGNYSLVYNGTTLASGGGFGASDSTTFTVSL